MSTLKVVHNDNPARAEVTVTVTGPAMSGKTTSALFMASAARKAGIEVSVDDVDVPDLRRALSQPLQARRVQALAARGYDFAALRKEVDRVLGLGGRYRLKIVVAQSRRGD